MVLIVHGVGNATDDRGKIFPLLIGHCNWRWYNVLPDGGIRLPGMPMWLEVVLCHVEKRVQEGDGLLPGCPLIPNRSPCQLCLPLPGRSVRRVQPQRILLQRLLETFENDPEVNWPACKLVVQEKERTLGIWRDKILYRVRT